MTLGGTIPRVEFGVASRARNGQVESGDLYTVRDTPEGLLIAVIDGLGHGADAGTAARIAAGTISAGEAEPIVPLFERCHGALHRTRGVAMSLAEINFRNRTMTWLAVGNVDGVLLRANPDVRPQSQSILQRGGVVGDRLPPLKTSVVALADGDTLIMATDGIAPGFRQGIRVKGHPQRIADRICERYAVREDDALVLVARYSETQP